MMLTVVTSNRGKVAEFRSELGRLGIEVEHLEETYTEVQTDDLEQVVRRGVDELLDRGLDNFVIDDSGLFVEALNGFPGVFSAYTFETLGCEGVLKLMAGREQRNAFFECVVGSHIEGMGVIVARGRAPGEITSEKRGGGGFGFDPIFCPEDHGETFAQLSMEEKNRFSHRGKAIREFASMLEHRMEED